MKTKIHMQDQVFNKVEEIMKHYHPYAIELSMMKFMLVGIIILLGVNL